MLETISRYDHPEIKGVTGMRPNDDTKSDFCVKNRVLDVFEDIIDKAKFTHIVMSYSTEGLLNSEQIESVLKKHGVENRYKRYDIPYPKYKNKLTSTEDYLQEYIFYIRKDIQKPMVSYFSTDENRRHHQNN